MKIKYPTIRRRYLSTFIDTFILFIIFVSSLSLIDTKDQVFSVIKFAIPVLIILLYEPILTSKLCTFGQWVTGIRVRSANDLKKITVFRAFLRYFVKILFSFTSYLTIIVSEENRTLHDFSSGAIVVVYTSINIIN